MRGPLALVLLLLVVGCGDKKKQKRTGDAAPVVVVQAPSFDGGTSGAATEEVEPNDSADVASVLAMGGTIRGKIDPDSEADYYKVEVAEAGALTVLTSPVDADLTVEIEDRSGVSVAKSDRGAARVREGVPNLGVAPGRYIVVVRKKAPATKKKPKKAAASPSIGPTVPVVYELTATVTAPAANTEREPDDDRGTANDLIIGDAALGFVGWTGDTDVWKLSVETLSTKNAIDIEVTAVEGLALTLELADGVGQPLLVRKAPKGAPLVIKNVVPVVANGAPPFHYLTIKGDRSNPETSYTLRVAAKPIEPDAELEPNDTPEKPMMFPTERTRVDGVWTAGDVDCFAIVPDPAPRTLEVAVSPSEIDVSIDLLVDGKLIAKSEASGKGTGEKLSGAVPANAKAVIRVRGPADAVGEGTYELTVREGPASGP